MGEKEPLTDNSHSHGMCTECHQFIINYLDNLPYDEYVESIDLPAFVIDANDRVVAVNEQGIALLKKTSDDIRGFLGGEAFGCIYAGLPHGCGQTVHCPPCSIYNLVLETRKSGQSYNKQKCQLNTAQGILELTVSTLSFSDMVRIIVHEVALQVNSKM